MPLVDYPQPLHQQAGEMHDDIPPDCAGPDHGNLQSPHRSGRICLRGDESGHPGSPGLLGHRRPARIRVERDLAKGVRRLSRAQEHFQNPRQERRGASIAGTHSRAWRTRASLRSLQIHQHWIRLHSGPRQRQPCRARSDPLRSRCSGPAPRNDRRTRCRRSGERHDRTDTTFRPDRGRPFLSADGCRQ